MGQAARTRVLCVDDESNVLDGLRRNLRSRFEVETAVGSPEGLRAIEGAGPFAVVISDLRMPEMDGIAFLTRVREQAPDTTRVLLTGNADLDAAMDAVNENQVFRFLTKPCPAKDLLRAVEAAADQHRLVMAERVLLEQTLHGSIKMLTEVLSLANPTAFGRASRARDHAGALAEQLGEPPRWQIEMAAMLSQVGSVALPGEVLQKLCRGAELPPREQEMVDRLPELTGKLLGAIPRLEAVCEILRCQAKRFDGGGPPRGAAGGGEIPLGSRILKLVLDFDALAEGGLEADGALATLRGREGWYDPDLLAAFGELVGSRRRAGAAREISLGELRPGMVLLDAVRAGDDRVLVAHGQEVSEGVLERLRNFSKNAGVKQPLRVHDPVAGCQDGRG